MGTRMTTYKGSGRTFGRKIGELAHLLVYSTGNCIIMMPEAMACPEDTAILVIWATNLTGVYELPM